MSEFHAVHHACSRRVSARRGASTIWLLVVLPLLGVFGSAVGYLFYSSDDDANDGPEIIHKIKIETFSHFVLNRGELESADNYEVRCQVKSRGTAGTEIIKIVEEGKTVKLGDLLVQFDDSSLKEVLNLQDRIVATSLAALKQAQADLGKATAALTAYGDKDSVDGTFQEQLQSLLNEESVAKNGMSQAEAQLEFAERQMKKGYIKPVQLETARDAVDLAERELLLVKTKLRTLKDSTYQSEIENLRAEKVSTEAALEAAKKKQKLDNELYTEFKSQIANCKVVATKTGQVVYAKESGGRDSDRKIIKKGAIIRQNEAVIWIPNIDKMQVNMEINESKIRFIKNGISAKVTVDAIPGHTFEGRVSKVEAFPIPTRWSHGPRKYRATVALNMDSDQDLKAIKGRIKPGLRANVKIIAKEISNVIAVPIQSVVEDEGKTYCLLKSGDAWLKKQVQTGPSNDTHVVITAGLEVDQEIATTPRPFWDRNYSVVSLAEGVKL